MSIHAEITEAAARAQLGDVDAAVVLLRSCLPRARRIDDIELVYRCYGNLTFALGLACRYTELADAAKEGAEVCSRYGRVVSLASTRLSRTLLRKPNYERWQHTKAVASQAVKVAVTVPTSDRKVLVAAAWLHDIGYTRKLKRTGFHPLDGAIYLRDNGWDPRIVALVAHHSGARFVPVERGFAALMAEFPFEDSPVSDALTYSDQTVGPYGQPMSVLYRISEAISRHGPDSPNALARVDRVPYLLAVADRVEHRLMQGEGT